MKLWLDDIREPWLHGRVGWQWAKTAEEAIHWLETGNVQEASLDHDLSIEATMGRPKDGELTGYSVVCWMEEKGVWPKDGVHVHSMNPVGSERMLAVINKCHFGDRVRLL